MTLERSRALQRAAEGLLPGGVNSPVRSFRAVGGDPRWIARGAGAWLVDVDGNRYLDYICSWGALLFGHAHPPVLAALARAASAGTSFGASSPLELALAEAVHAMVPAAEMLRFVNSGTEATMAAIRLARGATGRAGVVQFAGGYHGHADVFLAQAGSGLATQGLAASAGVPPEAVAHTHTVPYNDDAAVERALRAHPGGIAAIIVEPVAGNMGCVPPRAGFLAALRRLASEHGALLIFDEVMTGFRVAAAGAGAHFGVTPDLITLGKIVGGGLPCAAYAGRAEILRQVAPLGPVYQAGTLSGNPLAMAAGLATLEAIAAHPNLHAELERRGAWLQSGLEAAIAQAGVAARVQRVGSMLTVFFAEKPIENFADASACDRTAFARFHQALLERGVMWPPSQFEAAFFGAAHGEREIEATLRAAAIALRGGTG